MDFIIVERGVKRGIMDFTVVERGVKRGLDVAGYVSEAGPRGEAAARFLSATQPSRKYDNRKRFCSLQWIGESIHGIAGAADLRRFLRRLNRVCSGSAQGWFWYHEGRWQHR